MLKMQCSTAEVAAQIGVSTDTLYHRCEVENGMNYSDFAAKMKENGKASLRAKMFQDAIGGNVTLQIWLSKQYLGMSDKQAVELSSDPLNIVINEIAYDASRAERKQGGDGGADGQAD